MNNDFLRFLRKNQAEIRQSLLLVADRAENGLFAKLFPNSQIVKSVKGVAPKLRELVQYLDELS